MSTKKTFDFIFNKENNTVCVKRTFDADLASVWEAWTDPAILDQWWAPKPWKAETKRMDFRPGGYWLYAMVGPENQRHWGRQDYERIVSQVRFAGTDSFCDEEGAVNEALPKTHFENAFSEADGQTLVSITSTYASLAMLEKIMEMGFQEGFTMALENLDRYLAARFKLRSENKGDRQARVCSYLNFDGKTEEAFLFYQGVFKTQFIGKGIQRFGDIPAGEGHPPVADTIKNMVLHVELPITGNHILMGTDAPKEMGFTLTKGNHMHLCIEPESREEADRLFRALSEGGTVTMPMADMFFGAYFGEFSDRYGINWMISYQHRP